MSSTYDFGVSVDIGTTHITIHLVNLETKKLVTESVIPNPQTAFGADIISRLDYAIKSRENVFRLTSLLRSAIKHEIDDVINKSQTNPSHVRQVVVVGNTMMHHLFFDLSVASLAKPPYAAENKGSILTRADEIGFTRLPNALCYSPPLVESFIGADAPAVMLACGFLDSDNSCIIDIGTNTEIAVKSSTGTWIASAASGPAFESMSIECGMYGQVGAISQVDIDHETLASRIEVIGNETPHGICGTGAISALAALLDVGILLPVGSFNKEIKSKWLSQEGPISFYILADEDESATGQPIVISQPDVRMLQQSKAAIRGVVDVLLMNSELTPADINSLCLTGVFGSDLRLKDAYRIGLFPKFLSACIIQELRIASKGADMLMYELNRERIESFMKELVYVDMIDNPVFEERFVASLAFPSQ